jgi:hypothetical protein
LLKALLVHVVPTCSFAVHNLFFAVLRLEIHTTNWALAIYGPSSSIFRSHIGLFGGQRRCCRENFS